MPVFIPSAFFLSSRVFFHLFVSIAEPIGTGRCCSYFVQNKSFYQTVPYVINRSEEHRRVMEQKHVKTVTFQLEKPRKVFQWRRIKSFFSRKKGSLPSKCEKRECDGVRTEGERKLLRSTVGRNISKQSPKSSRRFATCSVMEEEDHCYCISLVESRRKLTIVHCLIDCGLL